tara:strand:+ start:558 stop:1808 length:1251 start_codon:yes stop_codon:yes gene_type:complete
MESIIINGKNKLEGSVSISGAKNAVLPIMAAALIPKGVSIISNVPDLKDTRTMVKLLEEVGAKVVFNNNILTIDSINAHNPEASYELVKTMRASFYVLGPLISRFGKVKVSLPGGCAWGPRPVDYHLKGLEELGAKITLDEGYIMAESEKLIGSEIEFDFPSVGATGNLIMASVYVSGKTIIKNAAKEPEIVQLCEYLVKMGANIEGAGTKQVIIRGVKKLQAADITVIPDRIEAGTFLIAGAIMGDITIKNVNPNHLTLVIRYLRAVGSEVEIKNNQISIKKSNKIKPINIETNVYPGFPTDLQAQWVSLMVLADGNSSIVDNVYKDRFSHVPELSRLGANLKVENNKILIHGVKKLKGAKVMSTDIRASASLIIAGLAASGKTNISRVYHIDRGYENIEQKFRGLGAKINRENN